MTGGCIVGGMTEVKDCPMHGLRRGEDDESPRARLTDCTCGRAEGKDEPLTEEELAAIEQRLRNERTILVDGSSDQGGPYSFANPLAADQARLVAEVRRLRATRAVTCRCAWYEGECPACRFARGKITEQERDALLDGQERAEGGQARGGTYLKPGPPNDWTPGKR